MLNSFNRNVPWPRPADESGHASIEASRPSRSSCPARQIFPTRSEYLVMRAAPHRDHRAAVLRRRDDPSCRSSRPITARWVSKTRAFGEGAAPMRLDQVVKLLVFFGNADGRRGRDARRRGNSTQRSRTRCRRPAAPTCRSGQVRADRHTRTTAHHLNGPATRIQGRPVIYTQRAAGQSVPSRSANRTGPGFTTANGRAGPCPRNE